LSGLRRALVSVAFAGVIVGAAASALVASSDHISKPGLSIVIGLVICWSFVGTGLYAWWRRPTNRFGALMVAVGFTFALGVLTASDNQVIWRRSPSRQRPSTCGARRSRWAAARWRSCAFSAHTGCSITSTRG
jgi:hypothetical protein